MQQFNITTLQLYSTKEKLCMHVPTRYTSSSKDKKHTRLQGLPNLHAWGNNMHELAHQHDALDFHVYEHNVISGLDRAMHHDSVINGLTSAIHHDRSVWASSLQVAGDAVTTGLL